MTVGTLEELVLAYSSGGGGRSSFVKLLTYFHENDENRKFPYSIVLISIAIIKYIATVLILIKAILLKAHLSFVFQSIAALLFASRTANIFIKKIYFHICIISLWRGGSKKTSG